MTEWDELKARIFDLVKTSDDVPTEEQNRVYDITVGALIGEGDRLQKRNKYLEDLTDNDAVLLDKQNLEIHKLEAIRKQGEKLELELDWIRTKNMQREAGHKSYDWFVQEIEKIVYPKTYLEVLGDV